MRITIEPTISDNWRQHKVVVESVYDDMQLDDVLDLIGNALVSYGFSRTNIVEYFKERQS